MTGHLRQHDPVSLLLIAAPESGKTSIVLRNGITSAVYLSDITGRGVQKICQKNPQVRHIVINDLIAVTAHKSSVSNYTIAMLNSMTEEGITNVVTPEQFETSEGSGKRGVITSITSEVFADKRRWWHSIGFTSRFLPFYYELSTPRIVEIKMMIDSDEAPAKGSQMLIPKLPAVISMGSESQVVHGMADQKSKLLNEIGFRRLKQFRALARAHALLEKRRIVSKADSEFLAKLMPYISFTQAREL